MGKTVLVTGATGNIGSLVVPALLAKGAEVRAFVRDAEKAKPLADQGAQLHVGDFYNQEALNKAADGAESILLITPPGPDAVTQGNNLLEAAKNSGNPYTVRISAIGAAPDAPTENGRLHYQSDQNLINSGLPHTVLRPHFFMQNLFMSVDTINHDGNMYWGMGDGHLGMIDVRDIADSSVELLLSGGHDGEVLSPTGPASITFSDIADIISKGINKPVNYIPVPVEAVGQAILDAGWGEWGAEVMMDYSRAYSEGWGDFTNGDVEHVTGNKPRSFSKLL